RLGAVVGMDAVEDERQRGLRPGRDAVDAVNLLGPRELVRLEVEDVNADLRRLEREAQPLVALARRRLGREAPPEVARREERAAGAGEENDRARVDGVPRRREDEDLEERLLLGVVEERVARARVRDPEEDADEQTAAHDLGRVSGARQ